MYKNTYYIDCINVHDDYCTADSLFMSHKFREIGILDVPDVMEAVRRDEYRRVADSLFRWKFVFYSLTGTYDYVPTFLHRHKSVPNGRMKAPQRKSKGNL